MAKGSRSRWVFFGCLIIAAYFVYSAAAGAIQAHRLADERDQAREQVAELEAKKAYLEAVKNYVGSDAYVEQEARRRLGYIRDGEVPFVVISPTVVPEDQPAGEWWERLFPR